MAEAVSQKKPQRTPLVGNILAFASGVSFFLVCMALPLVGPAGSRVAHAGKNRMAFLSILLLTLLLSGAASYIKWQFRKTQPSAPRPLATTGLCVLCLLMLVILFLGGFSI